MPNVTDSSSDDENSKGHSSESGWVENTLVPLLKGALKNEDSVLRVKTGIRLPYRCEIHSYKGEGIKPAEPIFTGYQTDLLVQEVTEGGWIPRVVIECKIGGVSTHDALTYSAKAATHKHIHPYLRYGILVGGLDYVPTRLIHHGTQFDFIAAWPKEKPSVEEAIAFVNVVRKEVESSQLMMMLMRKDRKKSKHNLIHRPIIGDAE